MDYTASSPGKKVCFVLLCLLIAVTVLTDCAAQTTTTTYRPTTTTVRPTTTTIRPTTTTARPTTTTTTTTLPCYDSDGGQNLNVKGYVSGPPIVISRCGGACWDSCVNITHVWEWYCVGNSPRSQAFPCPAREECVDGSCVPLRDGWCVKDADCEEGIVCDLTTGFCIYCYTDADCDRDNGEICDGGWCAAVDECFEEYGDAEVQEACEDAYGPITRTCGSCTCRYGCAYNNWCEIRPTRNCVCGDGICNYEFNEDCEQDCRLTCNGRSAGISSGSILGGNTFWDTVSGTLTSPADADLYEATMGWWMRQAEISLCTQDGGSANFDSYLCLFDGNKNLVASNDDACGQASKITYSPSSYGSAPAFLVVSGYGNSYGDYTIAHREVTTTTMAPTTTIPRLTTYCNGRYTQSESGSLVPTTGWQTASGSLNAAGDTTRYRVTATADGYYEFSLCSADGGSAGYDSYLCLLNSAGTLINGNDDACSTQSKVAGTLSTGTYYIQVSGYGSNYGTYTLAYRRLPQAPTTTTLPRVTTTTIPTARTSCPLGSTRTAAGSVGLIIPNTGWQTVSGSLTLPPFSSQVLVAE